MLPVILRWSDARPAGYRSGGGKYNAEKQKMGSRRFNSKEWRLCFAHLGLDNRVYHGVNYAVYYTAWCVIVDQTIIFWVWTLRNVPIHSSSGLLQIVILGGGLNGILMRFNYTALQRLISGCLRPFLAETCPLNVYNNIYLHLNLWYKQCFLFTLLPGMFLFPATKFIYIYSIFYIWIYDINKTTVYRQCTAMINTVLFFMYTSNVFLKHKKITFGDIFDSHNL